MRVAADANVLLSAILGHGALRAIDEGRVEAVTTLETMREVEEYLPVLAEKYGIPAETLEANRVAIGVTAYGPRKYRAKLPAARQRMEARDPDDVPLLALALALRLPIWTSDRDFEVARVETFTTPKLLSKLGIRRDPK